MALVSKPNGKPVPGVSPAAMQMANHVAHIIEDELTLGQGRAPRPTFKYWDKGTMATIGRSAAVAYSGPIKMHGFIAWLAWLFVHLIFLIGFRNKLAVFMQWVYSYFTYKRGARIITGWPPPVVEDQPGQSNDGKNRRGPSAQSRLRTNDSCGRRRGPYRLIAVEQIPEAAQDRAFLAPRATGLRRRRLTMRSARRLNGKDCSQMRPGPRNVAKNKPSPPKSADLILPTNWMSKLTVG